MPETHNLGPLPAAHPRQVPLATAEAALDAYVAQLAERHKLTSAERLALLVGAARRFTERLVVIERRAPEE